MRCLLRVGCALLVVGRCLLFIAWCVLRDDCWLLAVRGLSSVVVYCSLIVVW